MLSLQQKLNQLSLTTMSRQLDQTVNEAAARNLSLVQALESLADSELEARNNRSIERRFRLSRLHARYTIDSFQFKHHKSRMEAKPRILRLLDLEFLAKGTSVILIGNPGTGKTSCSPRRWICSITCWPRRSIIRWCASCGFTPNPLCL